MGVVVDAEELEEEREGRPIARRKRSFSGMVMVMVVVLVSIVLCVLQCC
jgi:hypothetical protein